MPSEEEIDFLEVDRPIPGQNYVCLSFISPEKIIENKNMFTFYKFYLSMNEGSDMTFTQFKEKYEDFQEGNDSVQKEFDEICDFQTNVRGVKIRGVYDSQREANIRAQVLQKMDNSFHVYVGQIGYWLPWDPNPNDIQEQEYLNKDLNRLNKEYNKNQEKKDMFYEEQKREKKMAALRENEEKKKANAARSVESTPVPEASPSVESTPVPEESPSVESTPVAKETLVAKEGSSVNAINESNDIPVETVIHNAEEVATGEGEKSLEETLNDVDPWMQRKMEESNSGN
jgi:hypothetical protein